MTGETYITVRICFDYDYKQHDEETAKEIAIGRVESHLSAACLYNEEGGVCVTDVEYCGEND